jgi:hypothetical protein
LVYYLSFRTRCRNTHKAVLIPVCMATTLIATPEEEGLVLQAALAKRGIATDIETELSTVLKWVACGEGVGLVDPLISGSLPRVEVLLPPYFKEYFVQYAHRFGEHGLYAMALAERGRVIPVGVMSSFMTRKRDALIKHLTGFLPLAYSRVDDIATLIRNRQEGRPLGVCRLAREGSVRNYRG